MDNIQWIISYGSYHMDHILWIISYGSYIPYGSFHMDDMDQAGTNGRVEATAGKHCQFDVPFSVQVPFSYSFADFSDPPSKWFRVRSNLSSQ